MCVQDLGRHNNRKDKTNCTIVPFIFIQANTSLLRWLAWGDMECYSQIYLFTCIKSSLLKMSQKGQFLHVRPTPPHVCFFFVFFFNQGHHTSRGNSWFSFSLIVLTVCGASLNESGRGEGMMMRSVRWGLTRDMVVYRVWADLPSLCHRRQIHVCALLKHMGEEDTFKDFFFILIILIKTELSTSPVRTLHFGLWTQAAA